MTSGAIQAYVPAALILVVLCHSLAKPKSVIFSILLLRSPFSTFSSISTGEEEGGEQKICRVRLVFMQKDPPGDLSKFKILPDFSYSNILPSVTRYYMKGLA